MQLHVFVMHQSSMLLGSCFALLPFSMHPPPLRLDMISSTIGDQCKETKPNRWSNVWSKPYETRDWIKQEFSYKHPIQRGGSCRTFCTQLAASETQRHPPAFTWENRNKRPTSQCMLHWLDSPLVPDRSTTVATNSGTCTWDVRLPYVRPSL